MDDLEKKVEGVHSSGQPPSEPTAPDGASLVLDEEILDESRFLGSTVAAEPDFMAALPAAPLPPVLKSVVATPPPLPEGPFLGEPAPSAHEAGLKPDQLFGKYRMVRDLGAGGMAQVFLAAIDGPAGFQKQCVVKKILPEYASDPNFSQMFINEARIAAMMSHQNIVHVFEFSQDNGQFFLAMEYVAGASLDRVIRVARKTQFPLGPRVAVEVGIAIANALAYAHTLTTADGRPLKIVHRDISPENILLSRDGAVKLTDFGVVKSSLTEQATVAGVVKGKWRYMSPEQVASHPVDARSDLFALGVVLYETAVGKRLFRADSLAATVSAVMHARIEPPSEAVPGFPPQLEKILMTALERDPKKRYQSAVELATALEQFRARQPWTSSGKHLASVVNTLFPKDGSQPGVHPGSGVSDLVAQAPSFESDESTAAEDVQIDIDFSSPSSPGEASNKTTILMIGAIALVGSLVFWFLLA
jgi:eukaryotic-like serine/threonine-protein kinase